MSVDDDFHDGTGSRRPGLRHAAPSQVGGHLVERGIPVFGTARGCTSSHQFARKAADFGGGQAAARTLRAANILSCGIGLPIEAVDGDMNGLRFGTPEIVRWGLTEKDMPELAALIARGLRSNESSETVAADVTAFRRRFPKLHFVN